MNDDTVTISKKEYFDLLDDMKMLNALIEAGVDNWSGYSYAIEILNNE